VPSRPPIAGSTPSVLCSASDTDSGTQIASAARTGLAAEAPLAALGRAYGALRAEFRTRGPALPALTWYDPDQTVAFWIRRMAQETVIHRIDAELAARLPVTPVPGNLLRWLWGRAGDDAVRLTGDPAWAGYLRRMLVAVTR
jgi:hypothetical protein